jgi:hypothetical protein
VAETNDPYWRLRPPPSIPDDELCFCTESPPIILQAHLSANPLSCIACNLEVPPERIGFSEALSERIALWQSFHDCFYRLWLDSGEFESWAKAELEDPASAVNKRGLELVSELRAFRAAFYWWFQDTAEEDFQPVSRCPSCKDELAKQHGRHVCNACRIVVAN